MVVPSSSQIIFPDNVKAISLDYFTLSFGSVGRVTESVLVAMRHASVTQPASEATGATPAIYGSPTQKLEALAAPSASVTPLNDLVSGLDRAHDMLS